MECGVDYKDYLIGDSGRAVSLKECVAASALWICWNSATSVRLPMMRGVRW
jgi:hypothetical protein